MSAIEEVVAYKSKRRQLDGSPGCSIFPDKKSAIRDTLKWRVENILFINPCKMSAESLVELVENQSWMLTDLIREYREALEDAEKR